MRAGHLVGNHTRHHSWAWWPWQGSETALREEISGWEAVAKANGIVDHAPIYRPPYLSRFDAQARISAALGYSAIDGLPSGDAEPGATLASVQQRSLAALEHCPETTCTLIFHDMRPVTRTQLIEVVGFLQRSGFTLVDFSPPLPPITTAAH